ncbi:uncharacterized protein NFIA_087950 [Aspergillus fischeri NRRL 181]|uniref:Uncharacterized protein n=1 Tax=Neosartorya fischeri (strain ATCC 1020 / DSM 3700 / CBS 544.65 / FGSC A1164 / JCM 1740 / NRRL 181 / WB 181) TaxID=331117 RepID=A1DHI2_NEOFI|nr:uncharacterized protein NFIA_087950 [Aspergillus fischeri NRRL 181]EAW18839.1 hypothetical protein NFIA_087950 [Aspergillus fischeri NRRL 181]
MTIDLGNPPRLHEDHNTRFGKLLSEMKKGHGSAGAEAYDAGAPGGDSQGDDLLWSSVKQQIRLMIIEYLDHASAVALKNANKYLCSVVTVENPNTWS